MTHSMFECRRSLTVIVKNFVFFGIYVASFKELSKNRVNLIISFQIGDFYIMPEQEFILGFLAHYLSPQKHYYGGLLITNTRGVPKEFRHSEGVRPTTVQSTLYGDSLEESLGTDALAPALLDSISIKPDILLLDKHSRGMYGLFALLNPPSALLVPLADSELALADYLSSDGVSIEPEDFDLKGSDSERVYAYIHESGNNLGSKILATAQKSMNLISPFQRLRSVLEQISSVESGRTKK